MDMEWVKNWPFKLSLKKARQAVVKFVSVLHWLRIATLNR